MTISAPAAQNLVNGLSDQLRIPGALSPVHRDAMGFPNTPCNHHIEPCHVAASNTTVANLSHASTGYLDPPVKINSPTVSSQFGSVSEGHVPAPTNRFVTVLSWSIFAFVRPSSTAAPAIAMASGNVSA